jgi:prevent-host-death family protein
MTKVNIHLAKTRLSKLVELVADGEEIVVTKAGKPIARLVAYLPKRQPRRPGIMRGKIRIKKNFNEPLPKGYSYQASIKRYAPQRPSNAILKT